MVGIVEGLLILISLLILFYWWFSAYLKFLARLYFPRSQVSVKHLSHLFYLETLSDSSDGLKRCAEVASSKPRADVLFLGLYMDLRSPTVLLTRVDDVKLVMSSDTHFAKSPMYNAIETFLGPGLLTAPLETWKVHRKLMKKSFTPAGENLDLLARFVQQTAPPVKGIAGFHKDPITPLSEWSVRCVASLVLGIELDAARFVSLWHNLQAACPPALFTVATNFPHCLPTLALLLPSVKQFLRARGELRDFLRTAAAGEQPGSLWAALTSHLSEEAAVDEALLVLTAGFEAMTGALVWALALLATGRQRRTGPASEGEFVDRLRSEEDPLEAQRLAEAMINETLR